MNSDVLVAVLGVATVVVGGWFALRSQDLRDKKAKAEEAENERKAFDLEMIQIQERVRQSLMAELHDELDRERIKRRELEQRVDVLEAENRLLEMEREKRIELERKSTALELRVQALERENAELKRLLATGGSP